jgi:hypothetical protein
MANKIRHVSFTGGRESTRPGCYLEIKTIELPSNPHFSSLGLVRLREMRDLRSTLRQVVALGE